jgi:hypothetical protein
LLAAACGGRGCDCLPAQPTTEKAHDEGPRSTASLAAPPPREEGPPRPELPEHVAAAVREADTLVSALIKGGIPSREAASVADMRGYRLYRRRLFAQARAWFLAATRADPSFELSLYNTARCSALLGDRALAEAHLARLRRLDTPLARTRLQLSEGDPDLSLLRQPTPNPGVQPRVDQ